MIGILTRLFGEVTIAPDIALPPTWWGVDSTHALRRRLASLVPAMQSAPKTR